jgi:hypothetical protein
MKRENEVKGETPFGIKKLVGEKNIICRRA